MPNVVIAYSSLHECVAVFISLFATANEEFVKMSLPKTLLRSRATSVSACVAAVALAILILVAVSTRMAQASDRFALYAGCIPMELIVTDLSDDAVAVGLTKDSIETATRSRLRAARLYIDKTLGLFFLGVTVNVVGSAFSINVEFLKPIKDSFSGESDIGATWNARSTGTHGGDGNYILGAVSRHVDKFIDEYLRVNESDCKR